MSPWPEPPDGTPGHFDDGECAAAAACLHAVSAASTWATVAASGDAASAGAAASGAGVPFVVAPARDVDVDVVRLTNSVCGTTAVLAADPDPAPDPLADELPLEPSTVLTAVIRCSPGRNTICPNVTVPVCVSPTDACQRSTASVVPDCQVSLTVTSWLGSNPSLTRFSFSSWTSGPSVMPEVRSRYAGTAPSNSTTGALSTLYNVPPGLTT